MLGRSLLGLLALVTLAGCAHVENTAIPTSDRYRYQVGTDVLTLDDNALSRLAAAWQPVAGAAEKSRTDPPDRQRALNNVALLERMKFNCGSIESLEIAQRSFGVLGFGVAHGQIVSGPSIGEEWKVRACEKYHWYLVFGDSGKIYVQHWQ